MPKVRRSKPKVYADNSIAATGTLIFSTLTQQTWFGAGGYSFVLEDGKGTRVRFVYWHRLAQNNNPSSAGYFSADDDLQPRYLNNDINQPYTEWQEENFFGYGFESPGSNVKFEYYQTGAPVHIYDGIENLSSSDSATVVSAVEQLVDNTVRAINYINELDITAVKLTPSSIQLTQDIKGEAGNTAIFRGFDTGVNTEGDFYGILTDEIQTINFEGGVTILSLEYHEKSGNLSNAVKKSLDEKSFEIGTLPINQYLTGKKLNNIDFAFDDSTVFEFTQQKINPRLGIPYYPLNSTFPNREVVINDGVIVQNKSFWSGTEWDDQFTHFNTSQYPQRKISNTSIFSYPNKFSDFVSGTEMLSSLKDSELKSKNLDIFLEKQNIYEDYEPYSEVDKIIEFNDSSWQNTNINNNSYHIKNSKQIKLDIDFSQSANALLIDTANTKVEDNYLELDNQTVTRYSQNTAYWNFSNNRWEYLNVLEKYPGDSGFYNTGNYVNILPIPSEYSISALTNFGVQFNINDYITDHSNIRNYVTSPSFRGINYGRNSNNASNLMQTSNSCGFPNAYKWNPSNNQLLKMSDYITSDFMLEKLVIKFKAKSSLKVNPDSMAGVKGYDESSVYHGLSFFFLRNNKDFKGKNNTKINDINYFLEADSDRLLGIDAFYPQQVTNLFSVDTLSTAYRPTPYFPGHQSSNWKVYQLATKTSEYSLPLTIVQFDSLGNNSAVYGWEGKTTNQIDFLGNKQSKFYYINSGLLDENGVENQDMQIKLTDSPARYTSSDYDNVYSINPISNVSSSEFSYRDIVTLSNVMFVGDNLIPEELEIIENDLNIDKIIERSSQSQDITLELDLKRSENEFYNSESFYFDINDSSNTSILEGKCEKQISSRIFNSKNISNNITSQYKNDVNQIIFDENQKSKINTYNYLLKPDDELIFGVSSYGNGNLISTMVELYDNIEITFIGKEVHDIKNTDFSKSIRKVITPSIETSTNDDAYTNLKENNLQKTFFKGFKEKVLSQNVNAKNFIFDSNMPNLIDYLSLLGKTFNNFFIDPSDSTFLRGNLILSNRFSKNSLSNDLTANTIAKNLFYDDVYGDYVFEKFKEGSPKRSDFMNHRLLSTKLVNSLNNNVSFTNILDTFGNLINYEISEVRKFKYSIRYFEEEGHPDEPDYFNVFETPGLGINILDRAGGSYLRYYSLPAPNAVNSSKAASYLSPRTIGGDGITYGFMPSDFNYKIKHNVLEDNAKEAQISIQRSLIGFNYYLVMHNTGDVTELIEDLKNLNNFALHEVTNSQSATNDLTYDLEGTFSRHSFPLTLRSFSAYVSDNDIDYDENISFTKEFTYFKNTDGEEFLITKLDFFEMKDYVADYYVENIIDVTSTINGRKYEIYIPGDTDFTEIGSPDNAVLTEFIATGAGTGSGQVIDRTTDRSLVKEKYYTSDLNENSFITRLVTEIIEFADNFTTVGAAFYANYPADYFDNLTDFTEYYNYGQQHRNSPIFSGIKQEGSNIVNGSAPTQNSSDNNYYENIIVGLTSNFSVKFYETEYELRIKESTPIYKNQFDDPSKRQFSNLDSRIKNYYHHFIDKKILQNDFDERENVYADLNSHSDRSSSLINHEFIYSSPGYYVKSRNDSVLQATKTPYTFIFKIISNLHNGINFSYMKILSIIDEKSFNSNFKPTYENTTIILPRSGYLRIYEPNILKSFLDNFTVLESMVPFYEIDLSDLYIPGSVDYTEDLNWLYGGGLRNHARKFIINSSNRFNWSNPNQYQNLDREDENDRDPKIYAPWGEESIKDKNINDLVYVYGDNYNNFPFRGKKGYIYGVQASTSLEESTYFETYRYGQFSDHIKYTQNHVTLESNVRSLNVKYTIEKKFYNSYYQAADESETLNITQSFNKNLYAQSNFPYIENKDNQLSQLNENNVNYDAEYVF